jgi:hypothetical protein
MQDAIFSQIYQAQNVASTPYQAYGLPTVADLSPLQQQAATQIQGMQGQWQPALTAAAQGTQALASAPGGSAAAQPYQQQAAGMSALGAASPYLTAGLANSGAQAAQPYANQQSGLLGALNYNAPAQALTPYVDQSLASSGLSQANPYLQQGVATSGMQAATPYLQQAGQSGASGIQSYMNPYTSQVTDQIAKLGARNLSENLLPAVSDSFVRAGQFGGSRMGEFGSRAVRDTQDSILNQQSQALQAGYGQAVNASQADLSRQAGLANTAGQLGSAQQQALLSAGQTAGQLGTAQQNAILQGGQAMSSAQQQALQQALSGAGQYGNMASTMGGLTQQQQQAMLTAGQTAGNLTAGQQQLLSGLGSQAGSLTQADIARQQSGLAQLATMAGQGQQLGIADAAALQSAGATQQAQNQAQLTAAQQQFQNEQLYPKQQLDWLNTQVRGMAPIVPTTTTNSGSTTGATYSASPLSQLATGLAAGAGLYNLGK